MPKTPEQKAKHAAYMRRYYAENPEVREKAKARAKARHARIKEETPDFLRNQVAERMRRWRAENPERNRKTKRAANQRVRDRAKRHVNGIKAVTPCADCGQRFPPVCMDFDHVRDDKESTIALLVSKGASLDRIAKEIEKCELVCACCHRLRTHELLLKEGLDMEVLV